MTVALQGRGESGTTHDWFAYDQSGNVWDETNQQFNSPNNVALADRRITATEVGSTGVFNGDGPDGVKFVELREQAGTLANSLVVWTIDIEPLVDVAQWRGAQPNVLLSGRVEANAQAGIAPLGTAMRGTDGAVTDKVGYKLANDGLDGPLDNAAVETNRTLRGTLRLILAALAGKLSGAGGTDIKIRDTNDTKDRIDATVDSDGNRTAVTLNDS